MNYLKFGKAVLLVLIIGVIVGAAIPRQTDNYYELQGIPNDREQTIRQLVIEDAAALHDFVKDSLSAGLVENEKEAQLQERFLKARVLYKRFEWAAEYFIAPLAQRVNGPPDQEVENADLLDASMTYAVNPTGLQVIEEFIFPELDVENKDDLRRELSELEENTRYLHSFFKDETLKDWRILDAAKQGMFRIITMGITGFDNPLTLHSMEESAVALQGLKKTLSLYADDTPELLDYLEGGISYLQENKDFDAFDRAEFITEYANEITRNIAFLEEKLPGEKMRYNRMLNQSAKTLFEEDAFNADAFIPGPEYRTTGSKISLGEKLFHDVNLSGNGSRSCFTCHQANLGFADGMAKNLSLRDEEVFLPRNTPTLLNTALQSNYFWDMRSLTLEDQTLDVIQEKDEMDGNLEEIASYLNGNPEYRNLFKKAFPSDETDEIEIYQMANALASYIRSLTKLNSRFDEYMRGDENALSKEEVDGFNLFMGKAKCATCHFVPLFNGSVPPKYMETEAEVIGVPLSITDSIIDPDKGWYDIVGIDAYEFAFKTPTVRNISQTAPYMHNGIYENLEEVMEFYNNAGAIGLGIELENMTLPEDSLNLSDTEIDHVIKFMESLDDKI